jgi:ATP-dependent Lon protease
MRTIDTSKNFPLLPLRDVVVFPHMVIPLFVGREKSVKALDNAMQSERLIVLVTQRDAHISSPQKQDMYDVGTVSEILQLLKLPDGTIKVLVEGVARVYLSEIIFSDDTISVFVRDIERELEGSVDMFSMRKELLDTFEKYIKLNKKVPKEAFTSASSIEDLSHLADVIASHVEMKIAYKQSLLDIGNPAERVRKLIEFINGEMEIMFIERKIQGQVRKQMEKTQKEYYLNEQMKVIKKELGQGDSEVDEIEELKKSIVDAKMSPEASTKALQEVKRLEKMPPMSAESAVVRNYIEWLRDIPWHKKTKDNRDIEHAMQILNEDHYGLEEVKERIIEYIAVRQLSKKLKGPILCFVGPPGVGKTSLGKAFRANVPGRGPRRGRDKGPPENVRGCASRQDHTAHEKGGDRQSARTPRRGGQNVHGFQGRSLICTPRGARSGAEQFVRGPLHGGQLRPEPCHVHHHGECPA